VLLALELEPEKAAAFGLPSMAAILSGGEKNRPRQDAWVAAKLDTTDHTHDDIVLHDVHIAKSKPLGPRPSESS